MSRPSRKFGRLFFEEYYASDPFDLALEEALGEAHGLLFPHPKADKNQTSLSISRVALERLVLAAQTWIHYGGHPADDKSICSQLTEVRKFARTCRRPKRED
jgi:hypothetical protein